MKRKLKVKTTPKMIAAVIVVIAVVVSVYALSGGAPTLTSFQPVLQTVSGLICSGDNIEGRITNTFNQQMSVENIRVLFNGNVVDTATIGCDKTVLQPGESTHCLSLQGVVPVKGTNEIAVVIGEDTTKETIIC